MLKFNKLTMKHISKLYEYILVASVFSLWAAIQLPENVEIFVGYFMILTVGIGHGANDLKIYFRNKELGIRKTAGFISIYAVAVLLGFGAFFIIPKITLSLFILVSGFHFGQEHFERFSVQTTWAHNIFYTAYGTSIIIALLYLQSASSIPILEELVDLKLLPWHLRYVLYGGTMTTILLGVLLLRKLSMYTLLKELFYYVVILLIFNVSSLVWGFAIYFILWHSLPSIHHQIAHLYGDVHRGSIWDYVKASSLYWLAALIFLYILYSILNEQATLFLTIIVAFLGGITFPHVLVMHRIHEE